MKSNAQRKLAEEPMAAPPAVPDAVGDHDACGRWKDGVLRIFCRLEGTDFCRFDCPRGMGQR